MPNAVRWCSYENVRIAYPNLNFEGLVIVFSRGLAVGARIHRTSHRASSGPGRCEPIATSQPSTSELTQAEAGTRLLRAH